jgi:hypothetical protein
MRYRKAFWAGVAALLLALTLAITLSAPTVAMPGQECDASRGCLPYETDSFAGVPGEVLADARACAASFYGAGSATASDMENQLIATFQALRQTDVALIFNPGGWGWDPISEIPGWESILAGLKSDLEEKGYRVAVLDYKRTDHSFGGVRSETMELLRADQNKGNELAARVAFLTGHLPGLRVILTGESNGAAIAEEAVQCLKENPRVYAIETGPPSWHPSHPLPRSLIIDYNGQEQDSFTSGDWVRIIRANIEAAFGLYSGSRGNILLYIGAPGHVYSWDLETVRTQMQDYLAREFPAE